MADWFNVLGVYNNIGIELDCMIKRLLMLSVYATYLSVCVMLFGLSITLGIWLLKVIL